MSASTPSEAIGWAILELMGHRKMAGYVRPVEFAGGSFLRIDVPAVTAKDESGPFTATQFYNPSAIYAITPTTLDVAVRTAARCQPEPVSRWELPALEPAKARTRGLDFDGAGDDDLND